MKREAKLLLEKACDALVLSIELFNRPHEEALRRENAEEIWQKRTAKTKGARA